MKDWTVIEKAEDFDGYVQFGFDADYYVTMFMKQEGPRTYGVMIFDDPNMETCWRNSCELFPDCIIILRDRSGTELRRHDPNQVALFE